MGHVTRLVQTAEIEEIYLGTGSWDTVVGWLYITLRKYPWAEKMNNPENIALETAQACGRC